MEDTTYSYQKYQMAFWQGFSNRVFYNSSYRLFYWDNFKTSLKPWCLQLVHILPGPKGQSVVSLIVDPDAPSLILTWSHTFVEFDNNIFSIVILLLPLIKEEYVVSFTSKGMCTPLSQAWTGKVWLVNWLSRHDHSWGVKPLKKSK